jgi:hypothetical protein
MNKFRDTEAQQLLILLKLDALRLFERIKYRAPEYLNIFSNRRTREHFPEIFKNRYDGIALSDLKKCSEDVIIGLDQFYTQVDELRWYLGQTQDMPGTVSDKVYAFISDLEHGHDTLALYIDAELGISPRAADVVKIEDGVQEFSEE